LAAEESATAGEKYDVYLSFPGKKEAEEWLAENGYDAGGVFIFSGEGKRECRKSF